ncbi:MAG: Holliday junction resolvase RuvX [Acidobacteria bacterium]|nr:Holliday junction resolvase RuvX [Acidobacteriota bacterium]
MRYTFDRLRSFKMPFFDEQLKGPGEETKVPGRILSLDLGTKRVGVAVCDELRLTVRPLQALQRTNWKRLLLAISELCEQFDAESLVIGLPLRLDGTEGDAAREAYRIARNLRLSLKLPVHLQDERLTSKEAEAALREEGYRRGEIKSRLDSEAAAIILRDFLTHLSAGS